MTAPHTTIHVRHVTRYAYDRPVFLEPHVLRLTPRFDAAQRPLEFDLAVDPRPAGLTAAPDPFANPAHHLWFDGLCDGLTITTQTRVRNTRDNAYDFVVDDGATRLPVHYDQSQTAALRAYLIRRDTQPAIAQLAHAVRDDADAQTIAFAARLTERVYRDVRVVVRPTGAAWTASRTWAEQRGACRDLTVLWIEACRAVGLAARFVSGYELGDPQSDQAHLHAWAEVYLPGAGWRGFDPTHGLAVTNTHIALAAGPEPLDASPLSGTFRGTGAAVNLTHTIDITRAD